MPYFFASLRKRFQSVDSVMYFGSLAFIFLFGFITLLKIEQAQLFFDVLKLNYSNEFGWLLVFLSFLYVVMCFGMSLGRIGRIRLGGASAIPGYTFSQWFLMLFCTGMNIGFMIWSVGEPVSNVINPPDALGSIDHALLLVNLHWGFYHWVLYCVVGLAIAYATYNRGLPLKFSSALEPLLGAHYKGGPGRTIDIFVVVVGVFSIATTLGLLIRFQASQWLYVTGRTMGSAGIITLTMIVTLILTVSSYMGIRRGVLKLSQLTFFIASLFVVGAFLLGPSVWLLELIGFSLASYLEEVFFPVYLAGLLERQPDWTSGWTVLYMIMWLSWAPTMGLFIAKISRGRTIREFIFCVLLVPTLLTFIWFLVFGGSGVYDALFGSGQVRVAVSHQITTAMFALLDLLPGSMIWQLMCFLLVTLLCVTSGDSGVVALCSTATGEDQKAKAIFRGTVAVGVGIMALLLLLKGGLNAISSAAVFSGSIFSILLFLMAVALLKSVMEDCRRGHILAQCK